MGVRKAVTDMMAGANRRGSRLEKTAILDQICLRAHRMASRSREGTASRRGRDPRRARTVCSQAHLLISGGVRPRAVLAGRTITGRQAPGVDAPGHRPAFKTRRRARAHRQRGRAALRYERGDDRPSAERCQVPRRDPRTLSHQAREPAQVPDTDPNLVGVGRGGSRFCRDRPRRPRRRELLRGVLLHPHHDRQVSRIESVSTRSRACSASSRS
jgi:hypothetical protein